MLAAAAATVRGRAFVAVIAERHEVSLTAPWRLLRGGGLGVHASAVAGPFKDGARKKGRDASGATPRGEGRA